MTETTSATETGAADHKGEAVPVDIRGREYALPPSAARAFVGNLAGVATDARMALRYS